MRTEKQRARHMGRYIGLVRYEVDRFLSRACCHNHAMAIWRDWKPVEAFLLPMIEAGSVPAGSVNMNGVLELLQAAGMLADSVELELEGQPCVNGWAIDEIVDKVGNDMNKIMHAFVRVPMLAPDARGHSKKPKDNEPAVNVWVAAKGEH